MTTRFSLPALGLWAGFGALLATAPLRAAPAASNEFENAFGLNAARYGLQEYMYCNGIPGWPSKAETDTFKVTQIGGSAPANILWPGETARVTLQVVNKTNQVFAAKGTLHVIRYQLTQSPQDVFMIGIHKLAETGKATVEVKVPPQGYQDITITPPIPETFGGYALILEFPGQERLFVGSLARCLKNGPQGAAYRLTLDVQDIAPLVRLGTTCNRIGAEFRAPDDPDYESRYQQLAKQLVTFKDAGLPICVEFGGISGKGPFTGYQGWRPYLKWIDGKPTMTVGYPGDSVWLPKYDPAFKAWVKRLAVEFGWPRGPITAMKLYNEPWEGSSCATWGADMLRYRDIYTALCEAVEEARKEAAVQILLGGCDSSSNTFDKLFPDGDDRFLKWLDFMSIHYQGLCPASMVKKFRDRQHPNGRVRIWDTESWCANSDERVAGILTTMYAAGHDRLVGIHAAIVAVPAFDATVRVPQDAAHPAGTESRHLIQAWSVAPAIAALQHFVGNREFDRILFDGLPWVYVFKGAAGADGNAGPEDGTVVVVGDISPVFNNNALFRTVRCLDEVRAKRELFAQLSAMPLEAPDRAAAQERWARRATLTGATLTIAAQGRAFNLFDYYGNPVPAERGKIVIPLDGRGFYLRASGKPGSLAALVKAVQAARLEGLQPVEVQARDALAPIGAGTAFTLDLHNMLNRPVTASLKASAGALTLDCPATVELAPNAYTSVSVRVTGGAAVPGNAYPLSVALDAGQDGLALHHEVMHANVVARKTIQVDGDLADWAGVLPQTIHTDATAQPTLEEATWRPQMPFAVSAKAGTATAFLAYDDRFFYFAAKVADNTPDGGTLRFETRDDDQFFYPEKVYTKEGLEQVWQADVRRYSYARDPVLPAGNAPSFDNVQIAFNAVPEGDKPWYICPPGTMPKFTSDWCTDYEYALNTVSAACGGGTELWRIRHPQMPNKHFYPRQPKSPMDGPVKAGALAIRQDATTRAVECAIPWDEIPAVKACLDAGRPLKFSFRVNDNAATTCLELAKGRSVSRQNNNAFKVDWTEHWANEVEFGWGK